MTTNYQGDDFSVGQIDCRPVDWDQLTDDQFTGNKKPGQPFHHLISVLQLLGGGCYLLLGQPA